MVKRSFYFGVYCNGEFVASIQGATKRDAISWVRSNVLSTHMGEWRKLPGNNGYEYATTIGRHYRFVRSL